MARISPFLLGSVSAELSPKSSPIKAHSTMQKGKIRRSISARERMATDIQINLRHISATKSARSYRNFLVKTPKISPQKVENNEMECNQSTHEIKPLKRMKNTKIDMVIDEICTTETTYVKSLVTFMEIFIKPMQERNFTILGNPAAAVFIVTLQELVTLNSTFLEEVMQVTIQEEPGPDVTERLSVLFNRFIPLFTSFYSEYAKYFDDFTPLVNQFKEQSKEFDAFLEACQKKSGTNQNFESYLILPIQRIPRYNLLLKRVIEYTDGTHPSFESLEKAVQAIGKAAQSMDETLRQKEKMEEVLRIQAQFAGQVSLFTLDRRLIRCGTLVKMSTKREDKVMIHLFNDLLLYSDILGTDTYHARRIVEFESSSVDGTLPSTYANLFNAETLACCFRISSSKKSFVLLASTVEEKLDWVATITQLIADTKNKISIKTTESSTAALWIPDSAAGSCSLCHKSFKLHFRRHHCRRCGFVVCGQCSEHRSILYDNDPKSVRVCDGCFQVLERVKYIAMKWLGCLIEFKQQTLVRRDRKNKWNEYVFDIKGGVLRQYSGGIVIKSLNLSGAIVVRRPDKLFPTENSILNLACRRSQYCFQITPAAPAATSMKSSPYKVASKMLDKNRWDNQDWLLCATSNDQLQQWTTAIEKSANKALKRTSTTKSMDENASLRDTERDIDFDRLDYLFYDDNKAERLRHHILKEIVRSEQSYVECIGECIRVFVQPLMLREVERKRSLEHNRKLSLQRRLSQMSIKKHEQLKKTFTLMGLNKRGGGANGLLNTATPETYTKKTLLDTDMSIFFTSMGQIYSLNQQLLDHLIRHLKETENTANSVHRVGAIFNAYAPLFQMYSSYACYHDSALATIESNRFVSMLSEIQLQIDESTLHRLRTYLNMPMERIPKYRVFLQELLNCTDETHMDYTPLQSSVAAVNRVVQMIHENIEARDSARKLRQIEFKYSLAPMKDRQFIKQGYLQKVCRHTVKQYHVVLFNDALLYASTDWFSTMVQRRHKLIELKGCSVSPVDTLSQSIRDILSSDQSHKNAFKFLSNQKSFILIADTVDEQIGWIDVLQDEINHADVVSRQSVSSAVEEEHSNNDIEMTIKSGWLPVRRCKKWKRMWVTVDYQGFSISSSFQASPEVHLLITTCQVERLSEHPHYLLIRGSDLLEDDLIQVGKELTIDCQQDRDEWMRAMNHCVQTSLSSDFIACSSSVSEPSTGYAPIYMFGAKHCTICSTKFSFDWMRHHCKRCGAVVCGKCSKHRLILSSERDKAERVCDKCVSYQRNFSLPPNL